MPGLGTSTCYLLTNHHHAIVGDVDSTHKEKELRLGFAGRGEDTLEMMEASKY